MSWFLLNSGLCAPAYNMALDEVLLIRSADAGGLVLRFYGWDKPAATFGYFQKYAEIEQVTRVRPLIRRPTGGGLVPHLQDWTYSLAVPPDHQWYQLRAEESYRQMHLWIRSALKLIGVESELATCCREGLPGQCFVGYEKFDVLSNERKIAGAAQRRNKHGLLIQGSIQPVPAGIDFQALVTAMSESGNDLFKSRSLAFDAAPLESNAQELVDSKYGTTVHNQRR